MIESHYNPDRRTVLLYRDDKVDEFYIRGGVCWPIAYQRPDGVRDMEGCIILGGVNVETKKVEIFEERMFIVVDNIISDGNKILYPGLASWLNNNWKTYFADTYYWNQNAETTKKYRTEIEGAKMINPKPYFVPVHWDNDDDALLTLWKYIKLGETRFRNNVKDSNAKAQLLSLKQDDKDEYPALKALLCFIMGIEKHPWIEPRANAMPEMIFKSVMK